MSALPLNKPSLHTNLLAALAALRMRMLNITRYPGQVLFDIFLPIFLASMPILLGRGTAGAAAGELFAANTGTENYVAYMLLGSSVFTIVSYALWHIAYWIRFEMETGTLETIYLTPTGRIWVLAGTAMYSVLRALFSSISAYFLGSLILGVNPLQGELVLALLFLFSGVIPLYGVTLVFGAIVLRLKEANAVINLMQWAVAFLIGVYFPIHVLPPALRTIALLFPPTWMTNGVRSAILGIGYFFGAWYLDLAVLWGFMVLTPLLGVWVFTRVENNLRRNQGLGQF